MNIATVRAALSSALDSIPSTNVHPYVRANPPAPGLQVLPPGVDYDYAVGVDEWTFIIQGFVPLSGDIGPQKLLDNLCQPSGASSVKAVLEADRTLGGTVDKLTVLEQTPGQVVEPAPGKTLLLVEWHVQVFSA